MKDFTNRHDLGGEKMGRIEKKSGPYEEEKKKGGGGIEDYRQA